MVIMDTYYSQDRLIEIWRSVDQQHLSYLEMEESSKKIELRNKLEDSIRDYLCIASHSQKFCFPETAEVLYRSASNKKDFSAYKAVTGWNAIQLYAGNLLSQPWRKEYRVVKTYCGFYKHQIEANLVGAEIMFEAMGYKHGGGGILEFDGPICPDQVSNVSKDCLIAYVECQIIKTIWEKVSQNFTVSWLDVLDFRKTYAGSPEQSIRALTYHQEQENYHQERARTFSHDHYAGRYQAIPTSSHQILPSNHSFPPASGHHAHHLPIIQAAPLPPAQYYCTNANGCCPNNYATYAVPHPYHSYQIPMTFNSHHQSVIKAPPAYATNGHYCPNGYHNNQPHYGYTSAVPTGQLIELDSHNNTSYDAVDHPVRTVKNGSLPQEARKVAEKPSINPVARRVSTNRDSDTYEDWDYVYRNLESQGYSKDLGERGDILSPTASEKRRRTKPTNLDEALNTLTVSDRPLKVTEALDRLEKETSRRKVSEGSRPVERKPSQSSSYENLSETRKSQKVAKSLVSKCVGTKVVNEVPLVSSEVDVVRVKVGAVDSSPPKKSPNALNNNNHSNANNNVVVVAAAVAGVGAGKDRWQCKSCTYLNDNSKDICEICSKTRTNFEQQMEIGGAECSKCTLVNPKDRKVCEACGASLINSPTYI